jgi:hypothetical protein
MRIAILNGENESIINWSGFDSATIGIKYNKPNAQLISTAPDLYQDAVEDYKLLHGLLFNCDMLHEMQDTIEIRLIQKKRTLEKATGLKIEEIMED